MEPRKAWLETTRHRIAEWQAERDRLRSGIAARGGEQDAAIERRIEELEVEQAELEESLEHLQNSQGDRFEELRSEFDQRWSRVQGAWISLTQRPG